MRGGDRLFKECGWMSGICSRYTIQPGYLKLLHIAAPHQSALPVPKSRQVCQLPLGGSQGVDLCFYHSTDGSLPWASGRLLVDPYSGHCKLTNHPIKSPGLACSFVTGRVRELPYSYHPRASLSGATSAKCDRTVRFGAGDVRKIEGGNRAAYGIMLPQTKGSEQQ